MAFSRSFRETRPSYLQSKSASPGNVAAAENLTRDIFVEVLSSLDAVRDDEAFAALLYPRVATTMMATRTSQVGR